MLQLVTYVNFPRSLLKEDEYLIELFMTALLLTYVGEPAFNITLRRFN